MPNRTQVKLDPVRPPKESPLISVQVAAEMLGVCDMTIRRRIQKRQFPALRTGRKSMIPRSFIERLLAQAEAGQTVVVDEEARQWTPNSGPADVNGASDQASDSMQLGDLLPSQKASLGGVSG